MSKNVGHPEFIERGLEVKQHEWMVLNREGESKRSLD